MDAPIKWNSSDSRVLSLAIRSKWVGRRRGLRLVLSGHLVFCVLILLGLAVVLPAAGSPLSELRLLLARGEDLGWILGGAALLLGYALLLLGQLLCLLDAPQRHGGKELLLACLLCSLVAPVCLVAGHFLDGAGTYRVLLDPPARLEGWASLPVGSYLQLTGLLLGMLGVVAFSGFVRALACCLGDGTRASAVVRYFWALAFLVGGTLGLLLQGPRFTSSAMWAGVLVGWSIALVWHGLLIHSVDRGVAEVLLRAPGSRLSSPHLAIPRDGQVALRSASFLNPQQ